jgi:hypothetical protein
MVDMSGLFAGLFTRSREPSEAEGDEPVVIPSLAALKREAKIGHGAYGSVYLFSDKKPSGLKQYAIKIIRLDQCDEKIERFQVQRAAICCLLHSKNYVPLNGFFQFLQKKRKIDPYDTNRTRSRRSRCASIPTLCASSSLVL